MKKIKIVSTLDVKILIQTGKGILQTDGSFSNSIGGGEQLFYTEEHATRVLNHFIIQIEHRGIFYISDLKAPGEVHEINSNEDEIFT